MWGHIGQISTIKNNVILYSFILYLFLKSTFERFEYSGLMKKCEDSPLPSFKKLKISPWITRQFDIL